MPQAGAAFDKFLAAYSARDSYRADACNRLGDVRYSDREFDRAVKEYDRAIALATPEMHYARSTRAVTLGLLGRPSDQPPAPPPLPRPLRSVGACRRAPP